jgi:hypothetical protein
LREEKGKSFRGQTEKKQRTLTKVGREKKKKRSSSSHIGAVKIAKFGPKSSQKKRRFAEKPRHSHLPMALYQISMAAMQTRALQ